MELPDAKVGFIGAHVSSELARPQAIKFQAKCFVPNLQASCIHCLCVCAREMAELALSVGNRFGHYFGDLLGS
jgi:hypothetical protein